MHQARFVMPGTGGDRRLQHHQRLEMAEAVMDKILIIDDSKEFCRLMGALLNQEGFEVISANEGVEGLSKAEGEDPDLIIVDSRMPGMSGREVFNELRDREKTRFIP